MNFQDIREKLLSLQPYLGHLDSCSSNLSFSNPASDYCNCGYGGARQAMAQVLDALRAAEFQAAELKKELDYYKAKTSSRHWGNVWPYWG